MVATTGEGPLIERALNNQLNDTWPPKLPGNHLTHFTLDPTRQQAAVIGSCGYSGGLSIITLQTGATTVIGYPEKICGEQVLFLTETRVAVARNTVPVPQGPPAEVDTIDMQTEKITARTSTPSDVLDMRIAH